MRFAWTAICEVVILAAARRKLIGPNLPDRLRTSPSTSTRSSDVEPSAGAISARNFCEACHAASRTAGVSESVVMLPPESGPCG